MICPHCSSGDTRVIDSRENEGSYAVRRRRECIRCQKRFTTYERCTMGLLVIKRDGRKEEYARSKLRMGIAKACVKRPIKIETIYHLITTIETNLRTHGNEVTSEYIGRLVMEELKKLDKIAYLRFASVCQKFSDVNSFAKEAKLLAH